MVAGVVILVTGWYPIDPILSLGIAVLIARGAWLILRDTVDILMEATPKGVNVAQMVRDMVHSSGVQDVHDLPVGRERRQAAGDGPDVQVVDRPLRQCDAVLAGMCRCFGSATTSRTRPFSWSAPAAPRLTSTAT